MSAGVNVMKMARDGANAKSVAGARLLARCLFNR